MVTGWCVLKRMVVVLKPKIKRSGGLEVALGQARFDSAVSKSKAVEWSGVVRWRAVRVRLQYGQMQMLRCAALRKRARGLQGPTRQA